MTEEVKIILTGEFKNKQAVIDALKTIDKGVKDVRIQSESTEKQVNSLSTSLKKLAQIVGIGILAKKFVDLGKASFTAAGQMEQFGVAFTTLLGSADKAKTLMSDAVEFAKKTPFQLEGVLTATKQLLGFNTAQKDIIPLLEQLGNISAGTNADLRLIAKAFGDVKNKGKLAGQEMIQFSNAGLGIQHFAEALGMTSKEFSNLQQNGQVSFAMVQQAIANMSAEGGKFFNLMDAQSKTFLGTVSNMSDAFFQVKVAIGDALLPVAQKSVNQMIVFFENLEKVIKENAKEIRAFAQSIKDALGFGITLVYNFATGLAFLIAQPFIKWLGLVVLGLKAFDKAMLLISKNPILAFITILSTAIGYLVNHADDAKIALLAMQRVFINMEARVVSGIANILNKFSQLSDVPGLGWTKKWSNAVDEMTVDISNSLDEIDAKIKQVQSKPIEVQQLEEQQQQAGLSDVDKIAEAKARNEELLKLEQDFLDGKIDLKTLEAEREQLAYEEKLAKLNEGYLQEQEMAGVDEAVKLELRKKYDAEKDKLNKAQAVKQKFFSKESLEVAKNTATQLVALENSKHSEMKAIGRAAALVNITIDTARGAIAAYASLEPIPFVGPSLGIAAAAALTAYGAEQAATVSGSFAVGASKIPQDMTAQIHKKEMIIPASFAESIRTGELTLGGPSEGAENQTSGVILNINFDGAKFYGNIEDEMLVEIGTRISELINEDLLSPIPTRSA